MPKSLPRKSSRGSRQVARPQARRRRVANKLHRDAPLQVTVADCVSLAEALTKELPPNALYIGDKPMAKVALGDLLNRPSRIMNLKEAAKRFYGSSAPHYAKKLRRAMKAGTIPFVFVSRQGYIFNEGMMRGES